MFGSGLRCNGKPSPDAQTSFKCLSVDDAISGFRV